MTSNDNPFILLNSYDSYVSLGYIKRIIDAWKCHECRFKEKVTIKTKTRYSVLKCFGYLEWMEKKRAWEKDLQRTSWDLVRINSLFLEMTVLYVKQNEAGYMYRNFSTSLPCVGRKWCDNISLYRYIYISFRSKTFHIALAPEDQHGLNLSWSYWFTYKSSVVDSRALPHKVENGGCLQTSEVRVGTANRSAQQIKWHAYSCTVLLADDIGICIFGCWF